MTEKEPIHADKTQARSQCGLCLEENKCPSELDLNCDKCSFHMCFECIFEYIRFNRTKEMLICPHCRQDLFDVDDEQRTISDGTLTYMAIMESLKKWEMLLDDEEKNEGGHSDSDSDIAILETGEDQDFLERESDSSSDSDSGNENIVDKEVAELMDASEWLSGQIKEWLEQVRQYPRMR